MTNRKDQPKAEPAPRNAEEALERARRHALTALAESADALRALVDAGALATTGAASEGHQWLGEAARWLATASERARSGAGAPFAPWMDAVSDALDDEIERWETRSRIDPEARAVLRAFLGVREILWEFGLRARDEAQNAAAREESSPEDRSAAPPSALRARRAGSLRRGPSRLERVPVEG